MFKKMHTLLSLLTATLLMAGCGAIDTQPQSTLYDLGPSSAPARQEIALPNNLPPISLTRVNSPDWLNSTKMYYRLMHVDAYQNNFYTLSRWNMSPPKLLRDRFLSRLADAGGTVAGAKSRSAGQLTVVIHLKDFSQYFLSDNLSEVHVATRVTLSNDKGRIDQKQFERRIQTGHADAAGGAAALAHATDDLINDILSWIVEVQAGMN